LFIEINKSTGKNTIVGVIYRPPNQSVENFLTKYNALIEKISKENKMCYMMGDYNLNLIISVTLLLVSFWIKCILIRFFPLITRPTRITSHTATLIDNIFTNHFHHHSISGLLFTDISDHLPVFSICFNENNSNQNPNDFTAAFHDKNKKKQLKFKEKLESG
jgi:hypothetical protein